MIYLGKILKRRSQYKIKIKSKVKLVALNEFGCKISM